MMRRLAFACAIACFLPATVAGVTVGYAQRGPERISLRSGESVELRNYFFIVACQSIMIGTPQLEVLEGPEEVTVTLKEGAVLPRAQRCAKPVPGGVVVATAKDVTEPKEAKLIIRLRFNTKTGERQGSNTYIVSLFPGGPQSGQVPHTSLPPDTLESTAPTSPQ